MVRFRAIRGFGFESAVKAVWMTLHFRRIRDEIVEHIHREFVEGDIAQKRA
jgi:hypothetical protein